MKYRIYASSEPGGFSATEETLIGTVEEPHWPFQKGTQTKGMSYRVVSVDANDVPSTPSDYVLS